MSVTTASSWPTTSSTRTARGFRRSRRRAPCRTRRRSRLRRTFRRTWNWPRSTRSSRQTPRCWDLTTRRCSLFERSAPRSTANAAQERANIRVAAAHANSGIGALDRAMSAEKSRVIADSPKVGRLLQLQNDVNLRRDELERLSQRVAQFRQEAVVTDAGITPLGPPSTPKAPAFPNYMLIIPGAILLGASHGADGRPSDGTVA